MISWSRARTALAATIERHAIWFVLLGLVLAGSVLSDAFFHPAYLGNIVRQLSPVGITAVGATFVMVLGGIDLSVGAVISLGAVICAVQMDGRLSNLPWALASTIVCGGLIGIGNGILVALSRASPFILTLGSSLAIYGLTQIYSGGTARGAIAAEFRAFFNFRIGGYLPLLAVLFLSVAISSAITLHYSKFGRTLYLMGSNPRAARIAGLPMRRTTVLTYGLSGALAALGGIALLARSGVSGTFSGRGLEFDVLAAIVLGGTTFAGGTGGVAGTVAGLLVLFIAFNLVNLVGLNYNSQLIIKGLIIIAASAGYRYLDQRSHFQA